MRKHDPSDYIDWDRGREGYVEAGTRFVPVVEIPKEVKKTPGRSNQLSIRAEERTGSLLAAAGTIWAVYVATMDYNNLWRMQILPPGPLEVVALGVLTWLHAKWRRSLKN